MAKRRFSAKPITIRRELRSVIERMDATSLRISQDILSGEAEIVFDRGGQRYMFRCDKYADVLDNLRAAQLTIVYLWRALEEYGVLSDSEALDQAFSQFFLGFAAMPDDSVLLLSSGQDWWSVLGVDPGADKRTIVNAFRSLAKVHHPDAGGDPNDFKRLRRAYEEAINYQ